MEYTSIIILCIIQGLTEFLPISSSGHLIVIPHLLGWEDQGVAVDVALHIGSLLAVLLYFWPEVRAMILSFLRYVFSGFKKSLLDQHAYLALTLVIATIPAVIFGLAIETLLGGHFRSTFVVACMSIGFGIILYLADRFSRSYRSLKDITFSRSLLIGIAQAIALIPGTSRSGICITAGRLLGLDRVSAARYSFLLAIPAISAGGILEAYEGFTKGMPLSLPQLGVGVGVSFLASLSAIHFMLRFLMRHGMLPFMIYRVLLGLALLIFFVP